MAEIPTWQCVVAGALCDSEGRFLMHRRPPGKQHGGLWEFPGGKVEPGETPQNAVVRELHEELGVVVQHGEAFPAAFAQEAETSSPSPIVILLYTVRRWEGCPEALEAGGAVQWFTPAEIATLDRPPLDRELCKSLFALGVRKPAQ